MLIVAVIIVLGVASQVLADRYRVPSVLFLIVAGIAVGPKGLGIVTSESFGSALSTIVGLSVAIIVFEGAFHLHVDKLREAPSAAFRLVTIGALISFLGTALAVRFLLDADWGIALVVGALLVATGPTVITPILSVVPVRRPVAAALETEGIVNDVTAAILAVVVFKALTAQQIVAGSFVSAFAERVGIGLGVGILVAAVLWYLITYVDLSAKNAPQNARLIALAGAIVAFSVADTIATEAGVAAVATAGIILGNADLPYEEAIEEFKGDITLLVLSFIFIALAALIEIETLLELGLGGVALVLVLTLVLRPLLVFVSTTGTVFTTREKLFVSLVAPRGIIPASVATLFAIELTTIAEEQGNPALAAQADILAGTVFLVILATVVFQGGLARKIAEYLDVLPMRVLVVGGGKVGRSLAERLGDRGEDVVIIEKNEDIVEQARAAGFTVEWGDGTDSEMLRKVGADDAKTVIAATGNDDANLLVCQLAKSQFDVERVIARTNNPNNVEPFEELGVRAISASDATAWAINNVIERPELSNWMTELGRSGDVQEIEITAEDLTGKSIAELDGELPNGVLVALVGRDGDTHVPDGSFTLEYGDHVTFLGRTEAVREAVQRTHPHD
ncbi:cation:proton antiporter [Salinilacihabitans rarus]|uniref:cation:proton antiporter domain-containing protein n=1 Tax=Salinilacihabitans rarus TaxID=2961596 RepID=UPI0020C8C569|nr:cation:proton antiporter [Salinilacihabitans rarus]